MILFAQAEKLLKLLMQFKLVCLIYQCPDKTINLNFKYMCVCVCVYIYYVHFLYVFWSKYIVHSLKMRNSHMYMYLCSIQNSFSASSHDVLFGGDLFSAELFSSSIEVRADMSAICEM